MGKHQWESKFNSCPLNAINPTYKKSFPNFIEDSNIKEDILENIWLNDPRLKMLKKIGINTSKQLP